MSESTTIRTVLEYAVMPIQRYEFCCSHCGLIASVKDGHLLSRDTKLCGDCIANWYRSIKR
jgi:hypothetical protein